MVKTFSLDEMKRMAKAIFLKALTAVDPYRILKDRIRIEKDRLLIRIEENLEKNFDLNMFENIFLVGTGKASTSMAQAIEEILGDRLTKGVITTKYGHLLPLKKIEIVEAGHPIPDPKGYEGAKKIQNLLQESGPRDLVIFLLSGGGSALLPFPAYGIELKEKQEVTQLLLDCGADIKEINTIRKHISRIKGGGLAKWAYPSFVIGFILSDVVGDQLEVIGSGPTVPDPSTFEEAWETLKKYDLLNEIAPSIQRISCLEKKGKSKRHPSLERLSSKRFITASSGRTFLPSIQPKKRLPLLVSILSSSLPPLKARQERPLDFMLRLQKK